MPSTYSSNLRFELMATGEKSGTWGTISNTNIGTLIEQAISGVSSVAHDNSASYSLTTNNGASDEARNAAIIVTGTLTAARNLVVPSSDKVYIIKNSTSGGFAITVKTSAGSGVTIENNDTKLVVCNSTDVIDGVTAFSSAKFDGDVTFNGASYNVVWDSSDNALEFADNAKATFGDSADLEIYHDGNNSIIHDNGTGVLKLRATDFRLSNAGNTQDYIACTDGGDVDLSFNGAVKLSTKTDGVNITGELEADSLNIDGAGDITGVLTLHSDLDMQDGDRIKLGDADDLQIYHNGTNSYIQDAGTGPLLIGGSGSVQIMDGGFTETMGYFEHNGAVTLYHNNSAKIATTSTGVDITGGFTATSGSTIQTATSGTTQLTLTSTATDASEGPRFDLRRDSASPADGDLLGTIRFLGDSSDGSNLVFAEIQSSAQDVTAGTVDSELQFLVRRNNSLTEALSLTYNQVIFNESGNDVNFRIEGDSDANLFFLNAGSNKVGIGKNPSQGILDVSGDVYASAYYGDGSNLTGIGGEGSSKAWAAFEQSGTHSFRDSFNFSSLSDIGTGQTRFSFTTNMANANYATTGCSGEQSGGGNRIMGIKGNSAAPATTGFDIANFALSTGSASDDTRLSVSVLGDQ